MAERVRNEILQKARTLLGSHTRGGVGEKKYLLAKANDRDTCLSQRIYNQTRAPHTSLEIK